MSQKKVIDINQFKKKPVSIDGQLTEPVDSQEGLTAAGKAFRSRFSKAVSKLESDFEAQLAKAKMASDVKVKINISAALKLAQASPLTGYSDIHRDMVIKTVEEAKKRCEQAIKVKFKISKPRPTLESLQKLLVQERAEHSEALAKLASQKMTEYLRASGRN